ncbi:MAG: tRNA lysidine(34) synthetase TilS [Treponema sp.]|jgi:tRNA(Ile)-lysidine synthase|nr:tRNA lysidine(34) synthetase TilS [Treponema sp.]
MEVENRRTSFEEAALLGLGNWPAETALLAAVSGGADSTAMLVALSEPAREQGLRLHCLHVEHGIRSAEESRGDAEAVRALCASLNIPCRVISIPPGKIARTAKNRRVGIEGAARLYRHAAWNREADRIGAGAILVAHTRDDLLETVLMRFLQGSGPAGLAAMPVFRGRIVRPLLRVSRAQTLRYLLDRGIAFRIDSTNDNPAYLRNRIRRQLIPLLDEHFPYWRSGLEAAAQTQALTAAFLTEEAARRIPWEQRGAEWSVSRERFFAEGEIVREEALFQVLDAIPRLPSDDPDAPPSGRVGARRGSPDHPPRRTAIRRFSRAECRVLDLGTARIEDRGGLITVLPGKTRRGEAGFSLLIKAPGRYKLKETGVELTLGSIETGEGFYGGLPLIVREVFPEDCVYTAARRLSKTTVFERARRSGYTGLVSAEDFRGVAAIIGLNGNNAAVVARREEPGSPFAHGLSFFTLKFPVGKTGGLDVQ